MAYCYWHQEDYQKATDCYSKLCQLSPANDTYKLLHAQGLYKCDQYYDARQLSFVVQIPELQSRKTLLQAAILYAEEDIQSAKSILSESDPENEDIMLDSAVILFKEDRYDEALEKYMEIKRRHGFKPEIAYCIALCHYRMNRYSEALTFVVELKTHCTRQHPELLRSLTGAAVDFDVSGSAQVIQEMFLVEGLNLFMAIEFDQRHYREARDALNELPMRSEEDLDLITLHNTALVTMEDDPTSSFQKLNFLLTREPPLPETFRNLLLGYCKLEYYAYASDLLAENTELATRTMGQAMLDFLRAVLLCAASKEEAYRKFDELCKSKADILRRLMRQSEDAHRTQDDRMQTQLSLELEATIGEFVPVLMCQAKVF
jgi:tetratricopeptide repeat protein 30